MQLPSVSNILGFISTFASTVAAGGGYGKQLRIKWAELLLIVLIMGAK